MFDKLVWQKDRFVVNDLVFRLEDQCDDTWDVGEECFLFTKPRRMMDQYEAFLRMRADFRPRRILELGIHHGGSLAFWFERFRPEKLVGVDIVQRTLNPYFQRYAENHDRVGRIKTYWGTDQSDRSRMRELVAAEFGDGLDLIIDDASHLYKATKASFETLFPLLRPGGLYIIEDWSWACWTGLQDGFLPAGTELPALVFQLVEATGTMDRYLIGTGSGQTLRPLIANLSVYPDFVVLERGEADVSVPQDLELEACISRSPQLSRMLKYPPGRNDGYHFGSAVKSLLMRSLAPPVPENSAVFDHRQFPWAERLSPRLLKSPWWIGHIPFAYELIGRLRPNTIVELGTYSGSSFAAFCQAVQACGLDAKCYGIDLWEGDIHMGKFEEDIFREVSGYMTSTYPTIAVLVRKNFNEAAALFGDKSVDLLHIDGTHTFEAVSTDFHTWLPKLSDRAVVLFHDVNVTVKNTGEAALRFGVRKFFDSVKEQYPHFEFSHCWGLGVLIVGRSAPPAAMELVEMARSPEFSAYFAEKGAGVSRRFEDMGVKLPVHGAYSAASLWHRAVNKLHRILRRLLRIVRPA